MHIACVLRGTLTGSLPEATHCSVLQAWPHSVMAIPNGTPTMSLLQMRSSKYRGFKSIYLVSFCPTLVNMMPLTSIQM